MSNFVNDPDAFLRQEVESASPARLRWLLIRKAIGLCQAVDQLWSDSRFDEASQWLLRVREIFGELLDGITDAKNPASRSIADIYIFLLISLEDLEKGRDRKELNTVIEILDIELKTWDLFVQRENTSNGLSLDGATPPARQAMLHHFEAASEWAGLNVEA